MRLIPWLLVLLLAAGQAFSYEQAFNCGGTGTVFDGKVFGADIAYPGTAEAGYLSGYNSSPNASAAPVVR